MNVSGNWLINYAITETYYPRTFEEACSYQHNEVF